MSLYTNPEFQRSSAAGPVLPTLTPVVPAKDLVLVPPVLEGALVSPRALALAVEQGQAVTWRVGAQ